MNRHKTSIALFAAAIVVYFLLGMVLPGISYTPDAQVEGGWNAIQLVKAMAEIAAPIIALILALLGGIALLKERK
jgi:hypothetical protein